MVCVLCVYMCHAVCVVYDVLYCTVLYVMSCAICAVFSCLNAWCSCSSITCHTHILQTATRHNFQAAGEENHHTGAEVLTLDDEDVISPSAIQPIPLDDAEAAAIVIEMSLQVQLCP